MKICKLQIMRFRVRFKFRDVLIVRPFQVISKSTTQNDILRTNKNSSKTQKNRFLWFRSRSKRRLAKTAQSKTKKIEFDGCHFCDCCHWSKNKSCFFFFLKALCLFALFMAKKRRTINAFEKRPISSEKVDFKKQKLKKKNGVNARFRFFQFI